MGGEGKGGKGGRGCKFAEGEEKSCRDLFFTEYYLAEICTSLFVYSLENGEKEIQNKFYSIYFGSVKFVNSNTLIIIYIAQDSNFLILYVQYLFGNCSSFCSSFLKK